MEKQGKRMMWLAGCVGFLVLQGCHHSEDYYRPVSRGYRARSYSSSAYRKSSRAYRAASGGSSWRGENAGPRMGVISVHGEAAEILETEHGVNPVMSAWGWQWELQYSVDDDPDLPVGIVEFVPLVAGLEQGKLFPSLNVLLGLRFPGGWEFCAGPNISPSGGGLTVAVGRSFDFGSMSIPVNLAYVGNEQGQRYSFTFGWNTPQ
jgi:hypothetical protein